MASKTVKKGEVPGRFLKFKGDYPDVFGAYDQLGNAAGTAGPLDAKTVELVRLAIVVGAQLQGAVHSHTRRALEAGVSPAEIRHAVLLAVTSLGFPSMMSALSWVNDVLDA
jgi:alkylhydroperoxidase/carboxymuconolactone decarboxylase family protein YurZ